MQTDYYLTHESKKDRKNINNIGDIVGWLGVNRKKAGGGFITGEITEVTISGEKYEEILRRETYLQRRLEKGILQRDD